MKTEEEKKRAREYRKKYYEANKDKSKKWRKEYYALTKDKVKAERDLPENKKAMSEYCKKRHAANKEAINEKRRDYIREYAAKRAKENPEKMKEIQRRYREKHRELLNARTRARRSIQENKEKDKLTAKVYKAANQQKIKDFLKEYRKLPNVKLANTLRRRIWCALKRNPLTRQAVRGGSAVRDLGCSIEELRTYLASKFTEGMTWDNHGEWHIDHIKPLASFDLTKREEFLEACHYTNLQPLWAMDNFRKSDKIITS